MVCNNHLRTFMTLVRGNMQGIEPGSVLEGKGLFCGVREELLHDVKVSLLRSGEKSGLSQLVDLVDDRRPYIRHLGIKLGAAESPRHLVVNLGEDLAYGGGVASLGGEVELGVVVAAGDLLDIFFLGGVEALAGVGEGEGFVGVGDEEGLGGGGEEEGGPWSGWGGGLGERPRPVIHEGQWCPRGRGLGHLRWGWGWRRWVWGLGWHPHSRILHNTTPHRVLLIRTISGNSFQGTPVSFVLFTYENLVPIIP